VSASFQLALGLAAMGTGIIDCVRCEVEKKSGQAMLWRFLMLLGAALVASTLK